MGGKKLALSLIAAGIVVGGSYLIRGGPNTSNPNKHKTAVAEAHRKPKKDMGNIGGFRVVNEVFEERKMSKVENENKGYEQNSCESLFSNPASMDVVYYSYAVSKINEGSSRGALWAIKEIGNNEIRKKAYNILGKRFSKNANPEFLEELAKDEGIPIQEREKFFGNFIYWFLKEVEKGRYSLEDTLAIARKLGRNVENKAYITYLRSQMIQHIENGEEEKARGILSKLLSLPNLSDKKRKSIEKEFYARMLDKAREAGWDKVEELLKEADSKGLEELVYDYGKDLVDAWLEKEGIDKALDKVDSSGIEALIDISAEELACNIIEAGDEEGIWKIIENIYMLKDRSKDRIVSCLVFYAGDVDNIEKLKEMVEELLQRDSSYDYAYGFLQGFPYWSQLPYSYDPRKLKEEEAFFLLWLRERVRGKKYEADLILSQKLIEGGFADLLGDRELARGIEGKLNETLCPVSQSGCQRIYAESMYDLFEGYGNEEGRESLYRILDVVYGLEDETKRIYSLMGIALVLHEIGDYAKFEDIRNYLPAPFQSTLDSMVAEDGMEKEGWQSQDGLPEEADEELLRKYGWCLGLE